MKTLIIDLFDSDIYYESQISSNFLCQNEKLSCFNWFVSKGRGGGGKLQVHLIYVPIETCNFG